MVSAVVAVLLMVSALRHPIEQVYDQEMLVKTRFEETQDRLFDDLAGVCGHLNVLHEQMVSITREVLETGTWQCWGINSPEHWLAWRSGLSPERSRQIV